MSKKDICLIGAGTFGEAVVKQLNKLNKRVLVIDKDETALSLINSEYNSLAVLEASDLRALKSIGIEEFETVIVGVSDNIEIIAALLEIGIKSIIARAKTKRHARVLHQIGVNIIIRPESESGTRTALIAANSNFLKYSSSLNELGDNFVIGSSFVNNQELIDIPLKELKLNNRGITVILVKRKKEPSVLPSADLILKINDQITVVGKINDVTEFFGYMNFDSFSDNHYKKNVNNFSPTASNEIDTKKGKRKFFKSKK
ncbi:MAG: potassium channel family protein [Metamycoplasmataceae bacterium]